MAMMIFEVYDALRDIGVVEEKARRAAEAVAAYNGQLGEIRADLKLLKWITGATAALVVSVGGPAIWLLVRVAAKAGAIS